MSSLNLGAVPGVLTALENEENIITACFSQGILIYISKGVEKLLGLTQASLIGNAKYTLLPKAKSFYTRCHRDGTKMPMENIMWTESQDGNVFTLERFDSKVKSEPSLDSSNHSSTVVEVADESECNDMKDFSETLILKDFIENAPMPAYSVANDGKVRWANKAMLKMMGYLDTPEEFVGCDSLRHHIDQERVHWMMEVVICGGQLREVPCVLRRKDGSLLHVSYNSNTYMDELGTLRYTRCFPRDMTETIRLSKEREEADRARVIEAEKRAEAAQEASRVKSTFIATVSHEIRTPINGVIGMASLLNMSQLSDEQQECVDTIIASADMLLSLIGNVLDVTKIESGKFELNMAPFDLAKVVRKTWEVMKYKATNHSVDFSVHVSPELEGVFFLGDANRIAQVLLNFLSNALKFTNEGSVSCHASFVTPIDSEISEVVRLEVVDTGIGIEDCSGLFSPFVQADRSVYTDYGGTGLGLSISRQLVTLMGGTVGIYSDGVWGHGTRVWAEFPLRRCATSDPFVEVTATTGRRPFSRSSSGSGGSPAPVDAESRPRILVVDDNKVNRKIALRMLHNLYFRNVDLAEDGQQAVDAVKKAWSVGKPYDIVFMDCLMPVMNGWEATQCIREFERDTAGLHSSHTRLRHDTVVLALTATVTVEDKEKSLRFGMDDFLTKPLTIETLDETVRSWATHIVI